jgi:DNA-binding LacI/PurR family transcriptional regulator
VSQIDPLVSEALDRGVSQGEMVYRIEAFTDRILADRSITAIVAVNDQAAIAVLNYLERRGIEVPRRLSIAGFDNIPETLVRGLTSYDFNVPGAAQCLVRRVIEPPVGRRAVLREDRIRGTVMLRGSVRAVEVGHPDRLRHP